MRSVRALLLVLFTMLCAALGAPEMAYAQGCGQTNPNCIVPTAPPGTSDNRAASTAFVQGAITAEARLAATSNMTFYVNKDQGSDSNNCLTSGAPCATSAYVMALIANSYDGHGYIATIQYQCATYPCTYTQLPFNALQYFGWGSIQIIGNQTTPDNIVMNFTSVANCLFCFSYVTGNWSVSGFKISSSVGSGNGAGIFVNGAQSNVTFGNIDFGALAGGYHVLAEQGGQIASTGNITISGGAADHMFCGDAAVCHETAGTITVTGNPAFSTCMYQVHGGGAVIGLTNNFSGSASGTSACADGTSEIDAILADLPGSGTAIVSGNGIAGGQVANIQSSHPIFGGTGAGSTTSNSTQIIGISSITSGGTNLFPLPSGYTFSNLSVYAPTAPGAGQSYTLTLSNGGSNTALTCVISGASATTCSDTTHSVPLNAGSFIGLQVVSSSGAATSPIQWSMNAK